MEGTLMTEHVMHTAATALPNNNCISTSRTTFYTGL